MVAILATVLVITLVSGILFYMNVSDELGASANADFTDHASDGATATELWIESNRDLAAGVAVSGAVESGDQSRIADRLETVAGRSDRVAAVHYVDRSSGEIQVSSQSGATGSEITVSEPSSDDDVTVGGPVDATAGSGSVVPFVAPAGGDHLIVVSASTASLRTQLSDEKYETAIVGEGVVLPSETGPDLDEPAASLAGGESEVGTGVLGDNETEYAATAVSVPSTDWTVVSYAPSTVVYSDQNAATAGIVALIYVIALNLGILGITVGGNLALALRQLADRASEIGEGNLDVELETERADEVGTLYREFDTMRNSLRESLAEADEARAEAERAREEAEQRELQTQEFNEMLEAEAERYSDTMAACADGDLTRRLEPQTDSGAMEAIADAFNEMIADLEETIAEVQTFADEVASSSTDVENRAAEVEEASEEVSRSVQQISDGANEQTEDLQATSAEVDEVSATIEEVAATTDEVTNQSDRVAELGADGRETAQKTIEEMEAIERQTSEVVDSIDQLTDDIEEISEVTRLIDDIAEQTNILALNANIEAARAGSEGAGFAVVANEVKDLAMETQSAVTDIEEMVTRIQNRATDSAEDIQKAESRITQGTESVEELTEALEAIVDGVDGVDNGLKTINKTTDQQAQSAQQIVTMVDDVAEVSKATTRQAENVAAAAEEATTSINQVTDSASGLAERTQELQTMLDEFDIETDDAVTATAVTDGGDS